MRRVLAYAWVILSVGYLAVVSLASFLRLGGVGFLFIGLVCLWCVADDWRDAWRGEPFLPWRRDSWYRRPR